VEKSADDLSTVANIPAEGFVTTAHVIHATPWKQRVAFAGRRKNKYAVEKAEKKFNVS
jgi:alkaline phosphatase